MGQLFVLIVAIALMVATFSIKPLRKTTGLLLVILGGLVSFTVIGLIFGIPMIIACGPFLFI